MICACSLTSAKRIRRLNTCARRCRSIWETRKEVRIVKAIGILGAIAVTLPSWSKPMIRALAAVVFTLMFSHAVGHAGEPEAKSPTEPLQGAWLFDEATLKHRTELGRVAHSVVTIKGDSFTLTKLMGAKNDLKGTLVFDSKDPA